MSIHKIFIQGKQLTIDLNNQKTRLYFTLVFLIFFVACKNNGKSPLKEKEIVLDPKTINGFVQENIKDALLIAIDSNGRVNDSLRLAFYKVVENYYEKNEYKPLWSDTGKWHPQVDSLVQYMDTAMMDGLFKEDYQYSKIKGIKDALDLDSVKRRDAVLWTKADLLLTDAFMHIVADLGQGRLQADSSSWRNDTSKYNKHFFTALDKLKNGYSLSNIFKLVQPTLQGYVDLKAGIRKFVDSMDTRKYTYVEYPYKSGDQKDSLGFVKKLQLRLNESDSNVSHSAALPDSAALSDAIKKYQKREKLTVDGKVSAALVKSLNTTDIERYNRIAVTLDRYKQLPDSLPKKYIWVNLPSYYMQMHDSDSVVFTSRIICGKPTTPTPLLVSAISDIVIYPTWTVPESIIKKEMLPALKKNSGYLARKGLNLYNFKGDLIDPSTVNWAKYSKGIPYKIQQGSGDDNALGVIKFNFENPYAVYLHDTNQRYLFKNGVRSLSHGCVRVQDWEKLAFYIVRNDSTLLQPDTLKYNTDSITSWIANKQKHRVSVKFQIPLFIRYFSCEGNNGTIKFYDDIYGDDKKLKEKYFTSK